MRERAIDTFVLQQSIKTEDDERGRQLRSCGALRYAGGGPARGASTCVVSVCITLNMNRILQSFVNERELYINCIRMTTNYFCDL